MTCSGSDIVNIFYSGRLYSQKVTIRLLREIFVDLSYFAKVTRVWLKVTYTLDFFLAQFYLSRAGRRPLCGRYSRYKVKPDKYICYLLLYCTIRRCLWRLSLFVDPGLKRKSDWNIIWPETNKTLLWWDLSIKKSSRSQESFYEKYFIGWHMYIWIKQIILKLDVVCLQRSTWPCREFSLEDFIFTARYCACMRVYCW